MNFKKNNPEAFIIYKHHPDVVSGNRKEYISSHILRPLVDCILKTENITDVINISDEIHTITSLTGFEGVLRGKKVFNYGLPFYAGYGFTEDKSSILHNRPNVDFETFCYHCLIEYPRYANIGLQIALTPEIAIKQINKNKQNITTRKPYILRKLHQMYKIFKLYIS